jgi:glycosyltransferase involved in cell wall biosynthesis
VRVIHVVQTLVKGGAETMIRTLCRGLAANGVDVHVISVYPSDLDPAERARLNVPVVELGRRGRADVGYFPHLVRTIARMRPDVVHAHLHTGQYAGRAAAVLAGARAIALTVHGDEPGGRIRWTVDRFLHARTRRFIVFTASQRERFAREQRVPIERVAVIPNGVVARPQVARAEVRATLGIPDDAFAVYTVGRLSEEKNQAAAIDAVAAMRRTGAPEVHLVIAGDGPLAENLRSRAAERGLGDRVHFLGYRADAPELCSAMDLFLLTSLRERMPMALGEAVLAGLAPVVTPWQGSDDMVRDGVTGFVATGFDADAVADAVLRAQRDAALRARIASDAQRVARTSFDADTMVRMHEELYAAMARETAR